MREIKFRVWIPDLNKMVYLDNMWHCREYKSLAFSGKVGMDFGYTDGITEYNVMQFTGLKDKKGKEIYEGDIAEIEFGKEAEIKYIKNAGGFFLEIHHKVSKEQIQLTKSWAEEIEIIGNKYEDGDLIECS